MDFHVRNGEVVQLTEKEAKQVKRKGVYITELTKHMTQEELEAFKKERYEKFLKPIMNHNESQLKAVQNRKEK
ncbi:hypothetical protein [Salirhabdus salicampi]|uniref:hypothetical protein n=1 Tax=Salirhabdus salicampi TaxID=476102 RepID=UPI0020C4058D|nr:hypothetical protein [Salirhabdus salicampi]MCP8615270.1 hypothetical protein [Salirhabdus salicampi]